MLACYPVTEHDRLWTTQATSRNQGSPTRLPVNTISHRNKKSIKSWELHPLDIDHHKTPALCCHQGMVIPLVGHRRQQVGRILHLHPERIHKFQDTRIHHLLLILQMDNIRRQDYIPRLDNIPARTISTSIGIPAKTAATTTIVRHSGRFRHAPADRLSASSGWDVLRRTLHSGCRILLLWFRHFWSDCFHSSRYVR